MENKLTLEHLAPYLPYGLKCDIFFAQQNMGSCVWRVRKLDSYYLDKLKNNLEFIQPILRPLSDLTKEIEVDGEKFVPMEKLKKEFNKTLDIYSLLSDEIYIDIDTENYSQTINLLDGYKIVQQLLKWHFDINNLIEKGLAIDINTLLNGK